MLSWLAAVVATTFLTWQIVNVAESRVSAEPVTAAPPASAAQATTTTTTIPPTSTTSPAAAPTTSVGSTPSTTSTTTTTAVVSWSVRTINSAGGTVVVRYRPGEVELQAATPSAGFDAEIEDSGPEKVEVEFEGEEADVKVVVRWDEGTLKVEIDDD